MQTYFSRRMAEMQTHGIISVFPECLFVGSIIPAIIILICHLCK